jgi:circadian clock protein KaiC
MAPTATRRPSRPGREALNGSAGLAKAQTGIRGFDEISAGGLPRGRATLVCGPAGSGKTLFAVEFLARGAVQHGEPGVFVSFEERERDLVEDVASLGFDLVELQRARKIVFDEVRLDPTQLVESGPFDLDGLFIRLGAAIEQVGARRVVLDALELLLGTLPNPAIVRSELKRLFDWLKARGVTAVVTAESDAGARTRYGFEEYVADCVVVLGSSVHDLISTRLVQIAKYRGSLHGTNRYPFLIDREGISIFPVTDLRLDHPALEEKVSSGIPRLDAMLGGGLYRGSSVLVRGGAGTGKSTLAASFANAACTRGERVLLITFEESPAQIVRNMRTIGIDLDRHLKKGRLRIHAVRASFQGLEMHVMTIKELVGAFAPRALVIDPITDLWSIGTFSQVRSSSTQLVDFLKARSVTTFVTAADEINGRRSPIETGVSSLMDVAIGLVTIESSGERSRCVYVLKARGTAHSNQYGELVITSRGVRIVDAYIGGGELLTGAARLAHEARERDETEARRLDVERRHVKLELSERLSAVQQETLRVEMEALQAEQTALRRQERRKAASGLSDRADLARVRRGDGGPDPRPVRDRSERT